MAYPLLLTFAIGISIRLWLFRSPVAEWLAEKNEVTTPLTSWKRVTEGLALYNNRISPYDGDIFHEMPLMLRLLNHFSHFWGPSIHILFVIVDVITAITLDRIAKHSSRHLLVRQAENVGSYAADAQKLILKSNYLFRTQLYVVVVYMFNPYTIATCVAKSTAVFNNLAIALSILYTLKGSRLKASVFIAFAAYMSMYPIMLAVPAALYLSKSGCKPGCQGSFSVPAAVQMILLPLSVLAGLLHFSFMLEGSWTFLQSTYGFILSVPDLTPNIGVFWYFFTEMFEHFRLFFICVFQINAFIYTVPLGIRLKDQPVFLMYMLVAVMAIFKSYPSYADVALYLSLLPMWRHCFPYMRNNFVVTCMFIVCSVLAPVLYHLWIYAGSANANFYFAITLVFSTAQIFLVTDLLFAFQRREYELTHGLKPPVINGKPAEIILD